MERLAKHPEVGGYGEVLLPGVEGWSNWPLGADDRPFFATYVKENGFGDRFLSRHQLLLPYIDYLYEPRRGFRAIGFKLMYDQLMRYPELLVYLRVRQVAVLHLVRANLLDVLLSREAMKTRRFVHARSEAEKEAVVVRLDTSKLIQDLGRLSAERRVATWMIRAVRLPILQITYEELRADERVLEPGPVVPRGQE